MDIDPAALEKALSSIKWSVDKLSSKGLLKESPDTVLGRITSEKTLESAAGVQWAIEAALEVEELKKVIFRQLDRLAPVDTPLASNTSSIPISRIARATQNPNRVLGLHFFGPVPLMGLVEVVKGEKTEINVFDRGVDFVKSLGKTPVRVHRDIPCFVMNRIFSAAFREAVDLVDRGIVSPEDVDVGMKLGYGWLIGKAMKALGEEGFISKSDLIEKMVADGRVGRKAGKGFYRYTPEGKRVPWDRDG
jgi:3-hydroxybutyryl-CoA dehydrogenase